MDIVNLNVRIDKQLRTDFQIVCKKQDTNASAVLREFIQQYVNENKNE
jgi:antitoxin component of RelBE/YafQ-DinJ toxin-antitoxin module